MNKENVAVLGASCNPERYSYKAVATLLRHGHAVYPVSQRGDDVLEQPGFQSLSQIQDPLDTVTLYVNPQRLAPLVEEIVAAAPQRVIFNPGTESPDAQQRLLEAGIEVVEACTLVLLETAQF